MHGQVSPTARVAFEALETDFNGLASMFDNCQFRVAFCDADMFSKVQEEST